MRSFLRRTTENWKLKTLAFALAVLLWVAVSAEQVTSRWITVPLDVQVTAENFQVVQQATREVQVRFSGQARDLLDVVERRPPVRLTINQVSGESGVFELHPRMVLLPGQVSVNAIDVRPNSVALSFARTDSRLVPVRLRATNRLGPGWVIVDPLTVEPSQVRVTGPRELVSRVSEINTHPVEVTSDDTLFQRVVTLDTTNLESLALSTRSVTVTGRVDRVVERVIANVPVDVGTGVFVTPARVEVRLQGPERTIRAISPTSLRIVVAIDQIPSRIPPEGITVPLRADRLPAGVQASILPNAVRLLLPPGATDTAPTVPAPAPAVDTTTAASASNVE